MKKRLFFIFTLISLLLTSCKLSISDGINNFSTMPSNNSNVYKGDFKGEITHYSDDKGIHISVNLDENSIYNCVSVFEVSNGTDSLIATAKPAKDLYRYLFDKPCGDIGYEVSKEEDMDEQENTISTSSRTNYLNGKVDFHFYFIEPGKTYTFVVRVEEIAGKYKDIVTGTEGILHDITSKYNLTSPLHEDSVAYHYGKVFSETASSSINYDDILSAEYDSLQDLYKFKSTNFTDSKYPFNLISEKDAYFSATFTYKSDNSTITVPYQKPEEGNEGISLSKFVEQSSNAKFNESYKLNTSSITFNHVDHMYTEIDPKDSNVDNETRLKYYTELYNQKLYTYIPAKISTSNIPQSIYIPDNRVELNAAPTEEGNEIRFKFINKVPNSNSNSIDIKVYRTEDQFEVGSIFGQILPDTYYTFTDHYPLEGKNTYYLKWNSTKSGECSVQALPARKYIPGKLTSSYDAEKNTLTISEDVFKNSIPKDYNMLSFSFSYEFLTESTGKDYMSYPLNISTTYKGSTKYDVFYLNYEVTNLYNLTLDVSRISKNLSKYKLLENQEFECSTADSRPAKLSILTEKDSVKYTNHYKFKDVSSMAKIKVKSYESDNEDSEELPDYIKEKSAGLKKITEYIRDISAKETDDGIEVSLYVPQCTNYIYIERKTYSFDENGNVLSDFDKIVTSTYYFDMKKIEFGNIVVKDYSTEKNKFYQYVVHADSINPENRLIKNDNFPYCIYTDHEVYIKTIKDSPYYVSSIPDIQSELNKETVKWNDNILVQGTLQWTSLPDEYKTLDTYNRSIKTTKPYPNSTNPQVYTYEDILINNSVLTFKCTKVSDVDKYIKDEYGQSSGIVKDFKEEEIRRIFNSPYGSTNWNAGPTGKKAVRGTYELSNVKTGIYNEKGIWLYEAVRFEPQKLEVVK